MATRVTRTESGFCAVEPFFAVVVLFFFVVAPFLGVAATAYYSNRAGFSERHLTMARSALGTIGAAGLLDVRSAADPVNTPQSPRAFYP